MRTFRSEQRMVSALLWLIIIPVAIVDLTEMEKWVGSSSNFPLAFRPNDLELVAYCKSIKRKLSDTKHSPFMFQFIIKYLFQPRHYVRTPSGRKHLKSKNKWFWNTESNEISLFVSSIDHPFSKQILAKTHRNASPNRVLDLERKSWLSFLIDESSTGSWCIQQFGGRANSMSRRLVPIRFKGSLQSKTKWNCELIVVHSF